MEKNVLKHFTIFIRSNDFMKDQYVFHDFFNNEDAKEFVNNHYPNFHIVWVRID